MDGIASNLGSSINAMMEDYVTITHNLANANTAGFKRNVNSFSAELEKAAGRRQAANGKGANDIEINPSRDFSQGSMQQTGRKLDMAIDGSGFFSLETPDGVRYTRNGQFMINSNGQLTDLHGRMVTSDAGPVIIPENVSENQISVSADGTISANDNQIARLQVVDFGADVQRLRAVGKNCYEAPDDLQPQAAEDVRVAQGCLESSNVDTVSELVQMITVSRFYEAGMRVLSKSGEGKSKLLEVAMA